MFAKERLKVQNGPWVFCLHSLGHLCVRLSTAASSHQQPLDNSVAVLALVVNHFDVIQIGVGPVHQAVDQVERDAVGEDDLCVHQFGAVLAVHVAALHPRRGPIVCEKHFAVAEEKESRKREMSLSVVEGETQGSYADGAYI